MIESIIKDGGLKNPTANLLRALIIFSQHLLAFPFRLLPNETPPHPVH